MSDTQARLDGLTTLDLQKRRRALFDAYTSGALAVQYGDGTRVQYRSLEELTQAIRNVDARISAALPPLVDPLQQPIRALRLRPWSGFC